MKNTNNIATTSNPINVDKIVEIVEKHNELVFDYDRENYRKWLIEQGYNADTIIYYIEKYREDMEEECSVANESVEVCKNGKYNFFYFKKWLLNLIQSEMSFGFDEDFELLLKIN